MFKILLSVVYTLFFIHTFSAQENKENILQNFNYIEYYKDSTIRLAMNYEGFHPIGYCIEFDILCMPLTIGEYRSGVRYGEWLNSDGSYTSYLVNFDIVSGFPGCGTGMSKNVQRFNELYQELITKTN
jgi:hypothetical protein